MANMTLKLLVLAMCGALALAQLLPPESDLEVQQHFADCIVSIVRRYHDDEHPMNILAFHVGSITTGHHTSVFSSFAGLLIQNLQTHTTSSILEVVVMEIMNNDHSFTKEAIQVRLGKTDRDKHRPNSLVLIALMMNPHNETHMYYAIFDFISWARHNQNSMNAVLLMMPMSRTPYLVTADLYGDGIKVYTWFQHHQMDPCTKDVHTVVCVDTWMPRVGRFRYNRNIYPKKVRYIDGCTLLIGLRYEHPLVFHKVFFDNTTDTEQRDGIFLRVFELVAKKYNLWLDFQVFKISQPIGQLDYYDAVGPVLLDEENSNYFQPMNNLYRMGYTFLVPPGVGIPLWLGPLRVFPPVMWAFVIAAYLLGSLTFWLLERHRDVSDVLINTLGSQLGTSMQQALTGVIPVTFFIIWLFYCLQIYTAYQSCLIGFITRPGTFPPIKDLEQLEESGLELGTILRFTRNRTADNLGIAEEWRYGKAVYCGNLNYYKCFDRVAHERDLAVLVERNALYSWYLARYWLLGVPLIVPLEEDVNEIYLTIYFKKESPLLHYFSKTYTRMQEAGITGKWLRDFRESFAKSSGTGRHDTSKPVRFRLVHVQGSFFLLILGLLSACCVFFAECKTRTPHSTRLHRSSK